MGGSANIRRAPFASVLALARRGRLKYLLILDLLDPAGKQQHDAILDNVDFQHVADYFFAPEKVKRRPYRPL